jgi:dipeptidyl aminopeptidase/acylaminoacyl peptidase
MDGADKTSIEPPGSRIAFVAGGDGFIFTVRRDGRGLRRLTRGKAWGAQRLEWSPDGAQLAVVSAKVPPGHAGAVLLMSSDGKQRRRLALLPRSESELRWTKPDVIQVLDHDWPGKIVSELPTAGGRLRTIGREPQGALSRDGTRRAIVKGEFAATDSQIHVTRADGGRSVNVSRSRSVGPSPVRETSPVWSPDGSRIAFLFDRGRGPEIRVMRADGSNEKRLAPAPHIHTSPDWSPDGRFLAYQADVDDDGLDEIYVVDAAGGRPHRLVEVDYVEDLKWQRGGAELPSTPPGRLPAAAPRTPVRTFTYALAEGSGRLADVRLLSMFRSDQERPTLVDLSPDGSLVALFNREGLALLDLRTNRLRPFATPRTPRAEPYAFFSPDGRQLLYRAWDRLLVRDVVTRHLTWVGRSASGDFSWLQDGRIVFLDDRGRLQVVRPGAAPRPLAGVPRMERFAITSEGRRLLYDRRCETYLLDRRSGRRKRLSGHLFVPRRAWAPNGSYFMLQWAEECDRKNGGIWAYHSSDVLFSANGTRLAEPGGRGATWSRDSKLVLVYPHQTGTAVTGTQGLVAIEPRRRRESTLLPTGNAYSEAFVGPGRWIVFTAYRFPDRVSYTYTAGGLYVGRIVRGPAS